MSNEQKANTNQTAESDSKAVQVRMAGQVEALSNEDKALFQMYSNETQSLKTNIPEIRVNYDEDAGLRGGFILLTTEPNEAGKMVKVKTFLDMKIDVTILRTRFKFGYFDQDEGERGMEVLGTPELDDYNGEVNLWDNKEKKVIFTGPYKAFKNYIVSNFADVEQQEKGFKNSSIIKHTEIIYVEFQGKVCRMYLTTSSRNQYWEYKEEIKGVPTFAFKTTLFTTKEKKGAITYFPIHFLKTSDNDIKKYINLRKQLDNDLKLFDEARANFKSETDATTVKGGDPEEEIKRKWNLNFPEGYNYPDCPKCGSKMVLRDSFKGAFFGCPDFPNCDGLVKLDDSSKASSGEVLPIINLEQDVELTKATAPEPREYGDEGTEKEEEIKVENIPF